MCAQIRISYQWISDLIAIAYWYVLVCLGLLKLCRAVYAPPSLSLYLTRTIFNWIAWEKQYELIDRVVWSNSHSCRQVAWPLNRQTSEWRSIYGYNSCPTDRYHRSVHQRYLSVATDPCMFFELHSSSGLEWRPAWVSLASWQVWCINLNRVQRPPKFIWTLIPSWILMIETMSYNIIPINILRRMVFMKSWLINWSIHQYQNPYSRMLL